MKSLSKLIYFYPRKCIWKCRLRKGIYLVSASMSLSSGELSGRWCRHSSMLVYIHVIPGKYSMSQEIWTRFCCALLCCSYAIVNSHEVFIHIHQGCFAGTGAIVRLPQCQWSKPDGYGEISQCITTTKQSKAKTVCIFLGIHCTPQDYINYIIENGLVRFGI